MWVMVTLACNLHASLESNIPTLIRAIPDDHKYQSIILTSQQFFNHFTSLITTHVSEPYPGCDQYLSTGFFFICFICSVNIIYGIQNVVIEDFKSFQNYRFPAKNKIRVLRKMWSLVTPTNDKWEICSKYLYLMHYGTVKRYIKQSVSMQFSIPCAAPIKNVHVQY